MALRRQGWWVSGSDRDKARAQRALALGAIDQVGAGHAGCRTFIAVPAGAVAEVANAVLSQQDAEDGHAGALGGAPRVVTDVAGIKERIVSAVGHPRFVGGHPMAGSEQEGVDGADPDLFLGATWVLTPGQHTSAEAYSEVQALVRLLGANPWPSTPGATTSSWPWSRIPPT